MSASPHATVKHELLVRYLDSWIPSALHGHRPVTFVCCTPAVTLVQAAVRVFSEFADLLKGHSVSLLLAPPTPVVSFQLPSGLSLVHGTPTIHRAPTAHGTPPIDNRMTLSGPAFGLFDGSADLLTTVAGLPGGEILGFLPALLDAATAYQCQAELVDGSGATEALVFGTSSEKALAKFKDELWALDEYAGVRLRDPADRALLDISMRPNIGPLRRLLSARVRSAGPTTFADLRAWTQLQTVYRAADATTAVQSMIASGDFHRAPVTGRLTSGTLITAASPT